MRAWLLMLGGMIVWSLHFAGLYGIASVFAVLSAPQAPRSIGLMVALTVVCLVANGALVLANLRMHKHSNDRAWMGGVGALAAAFSCVFVAWQGLAAVLSA